MVQRRWLVTAGLFGVCLALTTAALAHAATPAAQTDTPVITPFNCPLTEPRGDNPPEFQGAGGYSNDALWTNLTMWSSAPGIVLAPNDSRIAPDGTIQDMKWAWYRFVPGKLEVQGRRLDAPASPLRAWIPEGYGDVGFQVTGLTFPSAGCWEITGRIGEESLTFVVLVLTPGWQLPMEIQ